MKRIILNEYQVKVIENFINEAKKAKDTEEVKVRFRRETIENFGRRFRESKAGDNLVFATGNVDENDNIDSETLNYYSFLITRIKGNDVFLNYLGNDKSMGTPDVNEYLLNLNQSLKLNNNGINITMKYRQGDKVVEKHIENFLLYEIFNDFLQIQSDDIRKEFTNLVNKAEEEKRKEAERQRKQAQDDKDREEKEKKDREEKEEAELAELEKINAIKAKTEANIAELKRNIEKDWAEGKDKLTNSMIFEPGFLNMNNIFFFPKGYLAMDDILSKYGLAVHDTQFDNAESDEIQFKISHEIFAGDGKTRLLPTNSAKTPLNGKYDAKNRLIQYEHNNIKLLLKIRGIDEVIAGGTYNVDIVEPKDATPNRTQIQIR